MKKFLFPRTNWQRERPFPEKPDGHLLRWAFYFGTTFLLALLPLTARVSAQNDTPCECSQRWTAGAAWNPDGSVLENPPGGTNPKGIIKCSGTPEVQTTIVPILGCTYNPAAFPIAIMACLDPITGLPMPPPTPPQPGKPIIFLNFDVRPNVGTFQVQINEDNMPDDIGWALYYSSSPTTGTGPAPQFQSGNCNNLVFYRCGQASANNWMTFTTPNFSQATNWYLAVWDQEDDNNVMLTNFQARNGCGNGDLYCNLSTGSPTTTCNANGTYTLNIPITGQNGNYVATDPNATPTTSNMVCLGNVGDGGATAGTLTLTYPFGTPHNASIAINTAGPCPDPLNPTHCTATVAGAAPNCCLAFPPACTISSGPTTVCPLSTNNIYTGPAGMDAYLWTISGNGSIVGSNTGQTVNVSATAACAGSYTLSLQVTKFTCTSTCMQIVTVQDIVPPTVSCPASVNITTPCPTSATFSNWLAGFSAVDNCGAPTISGLTGATMPMCGGTTTITYSATDNCNPAATCTSSFTVAAPAPVTLTCPVNKTEAACQTPKMILHSFNNWLQTAVPAGGCNAVLTNNSSGPPPACGGSVTVTFTLTSSCNATLTCSATFTVLPAPSLTLNCPADNTVGACQTQAAVDASYAAWLASATVNSSCNAVITTNSTGAPAACGGSKTVIFTATNNCGATTSCSRTFTVNSSPVVNFVCATNMTTTACQTQAAVNTAFANWLATASATGGCNGVLTNNNTGAPLACGGSTTVVFTYTSTCAPLTTTCSATFTVPAAPTVTLTAPVVTTTTSCQTQAEVNTEFANWLASASATGGCNRMLSNNNTGAPSVCGGTTTVAFTVNSSCQNPVIQSSTFTVEAADPVVISCPANQTVAACQNFGQVEAAYIAWLGQATFDGGCDAVLTSNSAGPPPICGGSRTVTFTVTSACAPLTSTCQATFTVAAPPSVVLNCPANQTVTFGQTQAAVNAAFATWLATASASGGCNGTLTNNNTGAPAAAGGSTTVTFTYASNCAPLTTTCQATFTVAAVPQVMLNCPANSTTPSCQTQAAVNTAFANWLATASATGGCNGVLTNNNTGAPPACGGSTTVIFTYTSACAPLTTTCQATFTVAAPPTVSLTCPSNTTTAACLTQAAVNTAFATWLASASATSGCNGVLTNNNTGAPPACGGSTTVTFTYTSTCAPLTTTCQATFTVPVAPPVALTCPANTTVAACQTQAAVNAAFATWLTTASASGGCNGVLTNNNTGAPSACGGSTTVTFTYSSSCAPLTTTCQATFTVAAPPTIALTCPTNATTAACQSQAAVNSAFATWLATASATGGCNGVLTNNNTGAPSACGGSTTVTFTYASTCAPLTTTCQATFTVAAPPTVALTCPTNTTVAACQSQAAVNAAFATWLATASATGGCNGVLTNNNTGAPPACGGSTTVTFSYASTCAPLNTTCQATFTVAAPATVALTCPVNTTTAACQSQAAVNAAFATWLATATATGGCGGVFINNNTGAPSACGGSTIVTFTYSSACAPLTTTCQATFTVAAPPSVALTCPINTTTPACQTQAAVNAAFATWLATATASGGCGGVLTNNNTGAPSACGGSTTVTFTYTSTCAPLTTTCQATFTVAAPQPLVLTCPANTTTPACQTQAAVDLAYSNWLASVTASAGCTGVITNNGGTAPSACGGSKTVVFTHTSSSACAPVVTTCEATFTVAAPAVVVLNCPTNLSVPSCQTQAAVNTAYAAWLATVSATGGCGGVLSNNSTGAPLACGGSKTVVFAYTSNCAPFTTTCQATFSVVAAPVVALNCPVNTTAAACQSQAAINTAYATWLATATASGGCNGVLSNNSTGAPDACGGSKTVTFTYTSACTPTTTTCQATFTVPAAPVVALTCPVNTTTPACQTQAAVDLAYANWLATAVASGGCNGVLTNNSTGAPLACGGSKTVTFTYTSTCAPLTTTCQATFTVAASPTVALTCPTNMTTASCQTQAAVDMAYANWLATASASGGCNGSLTNNSTGAPSACGGSKTVTFTYTSSCAPLTTTCQATFTVPAVPVVLTCPVNITTAACQTQAAVDLAYANWLATASASGGCGGVLSNNSTGAPNACGGSKTVVFTYTSPCLATPTTCQAVFTVPDAQAVNLVCPANVSVAACQTQAAVNTAFANWLATASVTSGCTGNLTNNNTGAPPACGGSTTVTFTVTSVCGAATSCTSTFTVNSAAAPVLTCPAPMTMPALSTQAEIDAAYATWLASATATGGCNGSLTNNSTGSPSVCGGSTTVVFTYNSTCAPLTQTCSSTFTVDVLPSGIRVAKYFAGIDYATSGTPSNFDVIAEIILQNVGSSNLSNLSLVDNLGAASNLGTAFVGITQAPQIVAVGALGTTTNASTNPTINAAYNGTGNIFSSGGLLMPGQRIVVQFRFEVNPDAAGAPVALKNQATASGTVASCGAPVVVTDQSDAGDKPLTSNAGWLGDSGGTNDPTLLTNCWSLLDNGIACNDNLQVSLNEFCELWLTPEMVLEGESAICANTLQMPLGSYYEVFMVTDAWGALVPDINPATPNIYEIDGGFIGQTLTVKIKDKVYSNSCWGEIFVEDKTGPKFTCPNTPVVVACTANLATVPPPVVTDNCDPNPVVSLIGQVTVDNNICDGTYVIRRTYKATDVNGNSSMVNCVQNINVVRPPVDFPEDITWSCGQYEAFGNITNPTALASAITDTDLAEPGIDVSLTLAASILNATGSGVVNVSTNSICAYNVLHSDQIIGICGESFKILRTWTVVDWCTGGIITTGVGGEDNVQVIKIADKIAPNITRPAFTVSANISAAYPQPCRSTGLLLAPTLLTDDCNTVTVQINTSVGSAIMNADNSGMIPAPGLPLGTHPVTYVATDACGNTKSITVQVTVVDDVSPTMVCQGTLDVDLPSNLNGTATVLANLFDNGSTDNCCLHHFEVRRMTDPCDDNHNDTVFGPSVVFCCEDVGVGPVMVVLRAYDCHGKYNECMVEVEVNDKLAPVVASCPANQRITCDEFADEYEAGLGALGSNQTALSQYLDPDFGQPVFVDNCGTMSVTRTFASNLSQCNEGIITRTWRATDNGGLISGTCTQLIFVDHVSDFVVNFPPDITVECGEDLPFFGEPQIFNESCELIAVTVDTSDFIVEPGSCYKLILTYEVINWCVMGTNMIDQEVVEVPESGLGLPFPQCDLDGDSDCDNRTFRDSWTATQRPNAINATVALGPDTDPDSDPWDGFITYQQTVKIIDSVDPVFTTCSLPDVCIQDSLACAVTFSLPMPTVMDCSAQVQITATTPGLGNGFGPFTAGPGVYTTIFTANDGCGNSTVCTSTFTVEDCKAPTIYCKPGLSFPLVPGVPPAVNVSASLFDDGTFDNCSANVTISYDSLGTQLDSTFLCASEGANAIQIWFTDGVGNKDFCTTTITILDNTTSCEDDVLIVNLGGSIANEDDEPIGNVSIGMGGQTSGTTVTSSNGSFMFNGVQVGHDLSIVPSKDDNPLQGVTTYDLVLISQHILNIQFLDSPYKMIAADINNSKSITTFDLVQLRKLILHINSDFESNTSWRFVEKSYEFPVPSNPWAETFPEIININDIPATVLDADFVAVKIGDVNNSSGFAENESDERSTGTVVFEAKNRRFDAGDLVSVEFSAKDFALSGYQFTLDFDPSLLKFEEVGAGVASASNFGLAKLEENAITASWNRHGEELADLPIFTLHFRAKQAGKLDAGMWLSDRFTKTEAYTIHGEQQELRLLFLDNEALAGFELFQNKPNPFSEMTVIGFKLPSSSQATLTLTDASGRVLKVLEGQYQAGYNEVVIDRNELGSQKGVLYYRLSTSTDTATKMMILAD